MIAISYVGTDRRGTAQGGHTEVISIFAFVRRRYLAGWRSLTVYRGAGRADAAGAITRHPDTGRRILWAEQ